MEKAELQAKLEELVARHGFECVGFTTADKLRVRDEVRDMCASDKCHMYNRNWACPPAVGPVSYYRDKIASLTDAIVFETVAQMEDDFDIDTMMDAQDEHQERFEDFVNDVRAELPGEDLLLLGAGTCTNCDPCAYPDEPCRFPDRQFVSMEAAGLVVSDVCKQAGIPYFHEDCKVAYISCVVF